MGERIMRVGDELGEGRIPHPQCLADEYALSIVIMNSEPPTMGAALDMYPGLNGETNNEDYEDEELIEDWRDQMLGALLPPDEAHDYRRHDLVVMEAHGQGIYDTADPRHPLRWFDRDDLREQCASSLAYVRMSQDEQATHTKEAMARLDKYLTAESAEC